MIKRTIIIEVLNANFPDIVDTDKGKDIIYHLQVNLHHLWRKYNISNPHFTLTPEYEELYSILVEYVRLYLKGS